MRSSSKTQIFSENLAKNTIFFLTFGKKQIFLARTLQETQFSFVARILQRTNYSCKKPSKKHNNLHTILQETRSSAGNFCANTISFRESCKKHITHARIIQETHYASEKLAVNTKHFREPCKKHINFTKKLHETH